jgi:hypothetical protein
MDHKKILLENKGIKKSNKVFLQTILIFVNRAMSQEGV